MDGKHYPVIALKMLLQDLGDYFLDGTPEPRKLSSLTDSHFYPIADKIEEITGIKINPKTFKNYRDGHSLGKREYLNVLAATWLVKNNFLNKQSLPSVDVKSKDPKTFQYKSYWDDYVKELKTIKEKIFAALNSPSEGETLEFKEVFPEPNEFPAYLRKLICAFANTNGGDIIIGIKETYDGETKRNIPIGINPEERIWQKTRGEWTRISPKPHIEIRWSYLLDEEKVLCNIRVGKSDTSCIVDGVKWIRVGEEIVDEAKHNNLVNVSNARYELGKIYHAVLKTLATNEGKVLLQSLSACVTDTFVKYLSDILNEIYIKKSSTFSVRTKTKAKHSIKIALDKLKEGTTKEFFDIVKNIPEINTTIKGSITQLKKALQINLEDGYRLSIDDIKEKLKYFEELAEVIDNKVIDKLDIVETETQKKS